MNRRQAVLLARKLRREQTEAEVYFWSKVRNRRLNNLKFFRQYIIEYQLVNGRNKYFIPDFYYSKSKLIIEIDGRIHLSKKEYDNYRTSILQNLGYRVIRYSNEEVLRKWPTVLD